MTDYWENLKEQIDRAIAAVHCNHDECNSARRAFRFTPCEQRAIDSAVAEAGDPYDAVALCEDCDGPIDDDGICAGCAADRQLARCDEYLETGSV